MPASWARARPSATPQRRVRELAACGQIVGPHHLDVRVPALAIANRAELVLVRQKREIRRVIAVKARRYFLPEISSTFHGRDIFAPVAARIAMGLELELLGGTVRSYRRQTLPRPRRRRLTPRSARGEQTVEERGEVVYVDRFGNAVTNITPRKGDRLKLMETARSHRFRRIEPTYASVPRGTALLLVGSLGFLEIAVNRGNAASDLDLRRGDRVVALWRAER